MQHVVNNKNFIYQTKQITFFFHSNGMDNFIPSMIELLTNKHYLQQEKLNIFPTL